MWFKGSFVHRVKRVYARSGLLFKRISQVHYWFFFTTTDDYYILLYIHVKFVIYVIIHYIQQFLDSGHVIGNSLLLYNILTKILLLIVRSCGVVETCRAWKSTKLTTAGSNPIARHVSGGCGFFIIEEDEASLLVEIQLRINAIHAIYSR